MRRYILLTLCLLTACAETWAFSEKFYSGDRLSSSVITCMCQDKHGYIWIGTEYGLNKFDGYHFTAYLNHDGDEKSLKCNQISKLACDREGNLWVGTATGLNRYDYHADGFVKLQDAQGHVPRITDIIQLRSGRLLIGTAGYGLYEPQKEGNGLQQVKLGLPVKDDAYYSRLFEDSKGNIWKAGEANSMFCHTRQGRNIPMQSFYGTVDAIFEFAGQVYVLAQHGLMMARGNRLVKADIQYGQFEGTDMSFHSFCKDARGNVYLGTVGSGLYMLRKGTKRLERMVQTGAPVDLNTSKIWALIADRQQNIWIGCRQKGLLLLSNSKNQFVSWSFTQQDIKLGTSVSSACLGDNGRVWCVVQNNGVYGFDAQGNIVAHPHAPEGCASICRDGKGNYWLGTDRGMYRYQPNTGAAQLVMPFNSDGINTMEDDGRGHIYASVYSKGICVYDVATGKWTNYNFYMKKSPKGCLCNNWVQAIHAARNGMVWIATSSGLDCLNPATGKFTKLKWENGQNDLWCSCIGELRNGTILVGISKGLYYYNRKQKLMMPYPGADKLSDNMIASINEDKMGNIWCSTFMGIWEYQRRQQQWIGHVTGNGLTTKEYVMNVSMHAKDDRIYLGTNDGITSFKPEDMMRQRYTQIELKLTAFIIDGRNVNTDTRSNGDVVTECGVETSEHFTLSYLDNTFTMEFSTFNYANPDNVTYAYRMNGSNWTSQQDGDNVIAFHHVQPGLYHIDVKALVNGRWTDVNSFTVLVKAPWYKSPYAYILYMILAISGAGYFFFTYSKKKAEQLDEEKMKFLINATHDIRSPLTLIMSPLDKLKTRLNNAKPGDTMDLCRNDSLRDVETIENNANRILNLVNQILDVRKIDKQQMHLHCQPTEMVDFISGICKMYEYAAGDRHIALEFVHPTVDKLEVWIDRTHFDKVINNLLSNAFKYSFDEGHITVRLNTTTDAKNPQREYAQIAVTDDGIGLGNDVSKHIFDRFYQGGNSRAMHIKGTGIGLNLCKMIVDLHHGTIEADHNPAGKGSVFRVLLPLGNAHLRTEEMNIVPVVKAAPKPIARSSFHVLIVDDDAEIRQYVSNELGQYFHFGQAANGKEGMHELLTNHYDCVVSDVMMPEMDGFTLLRLIKTNANISDTPVIMLTSKSDVANRLEGLGRGADAYLSKPFNMEELHINISNVISNVQRLRGKFSGAQQGNEKINTIEAKGNDDQLMERVVKVINEHLSDSDFNVDMLTEEVGISRAQLHRKMKEITGIPTSEFLRNIRLEQAARLLKEQKINITQIAYTVGFSNPAHFSTVFKKHFGVSPKEYVEQNC